MVTTIVGAILWSSSLANLNDSSGQDTTRLKSHGGTIDLLAKLEEN